MIASPVVDNHSVEAIRARDPHAMSRLVRQERRRLYSVINRMVHDTEETESLVQETFLIAFRNIDSFQGRSKLGTWVCGIGAKLALKSLYASKRYEACSEEEMERIQARTASPMDDEAYKANDPEAVYERNEQALLVRAAIDRLPLKMRTIIILRDLAGFSTRETARILYVSEANARVRLHRARNVLRKLLEPHFGIRSGNKRLPN